MYRLSLNNDVNWCMANDKPELPLLGVGHPRCRGQVMRSDRPMARRRWPVAAMLAALAGAALAGAALADGEPRFADGAAMFPANCAVCHRANGAGTPGLAPPLTEYPPRFVASAEGRRQLALTVLFGMYGDIVVGGRHYNFKMPEFTRLDDAALAATLNYVVFDLGHAAAALALLAAADLAAQRARALTIAPRATIAPRSWRGSRRERRAAAVGRRPGRGARGGAGRGRARAA